VDQTEYRYVERGARHAVSEHQQEHGERQQDGDADRDLLTGVRRNAEHEQHQDGQQRARQDDVHQVERAAPRQVQREQHLQTPRPHSAGGCCMGSHASRFSSHIPTRRLPHVQLQLS